MSHVNEVSPKGFAGYPKMRRAIALWMEEFDRVKYLPIGPIDVKLRISEGLFGEVGIVLGIEGAHVDNAKESVAWPLNLEFSHSPRKLAELVSGEVGEALMRLLFKVSMADGWRKGGLPIN